MADEVSKMQKNIKLNLLHESTPPLGTTSPLSSTEASKRNSKIHWRRTREIEKLRNERD
jgi:hypothetical protein